MVKNSFVVFSLLLSLRTSPILKENIEPFDPTTSRYHPFPGLRERRTLHNQSERVAAVCMNCPTQRLFSICIFKK